MKNNALTFGVFIILLAFVSSSSVEARPLSALKGGFASIKSKAETGLNKLKKPLATAYVMLMLTGLAHAGDITLSTPDNQSTDVREAGKLILANQMGEEWSFVRKAKPPKHHSRVYYLLMDAGDFWRVMHLTYIGESDDRPSRSLFLGAWAYTVWQGEDVMDVTTNTLIGRKGVIQEDIVDYQHHVIFRHPADKRIYDLTVLSLGGLDMQEHDPIKVTTFYPSEGSELEVLTYRTDIANLLHVRNYPLARRDCVAVTNDGEALLALNTCLIPWTPSIIGSPVFNKKTGSQIGIYVGQEIFVNQQNGEERELAMTVMIPEDFYQRLGVRSLSVKPKDLLATTWAEIKLRD